MRRYRMLYIAPDIILDMPKALSQYLSGDYLTIWLKGIEQGSAADHQRVVSGFGDFEFRYMLPNRLPFGVKQVHDIWWFVRTGMSLRKAAGRYDVIVTYGPYRTAFAGLILRFLIGAPLIVEYPLNPRLGFAFDTGFVARVKNRVAPAIAGWMARRADSIMILYPDQLKHMRMRSDLRAHVVHTFTRQSAVPADVPSEKTILLMGKPLQRKGADLLLRAFREIHSEFPEFRVVIAGSDEDTSVLLELAEGLPVEFVGRLPAEQALRLLASCAVFAVPSRSEGTPRVLIEAMAAGRPVIASNVDGNPYLVHDGETGLVFPNEDCHALAAGLRRLLADPSYATRLGSQGRDFIISQFSEGRVAEMWAAAVRDTVEKRA